MDQAVLERRWRRRASSLSGRLNLGWWLERFNALAVAGLLLFALAIVALRTWREGFLQTGLVFGSATGLVVTFALAAWIWERRRFVGVEEGLVRLDDRLGLHNRLSSASKKIGPWPEFAPDDLRALPRWQPARAWLPGLTALALVAAAWWIPVPKREAGPLVAPVEPGAWEQMEDWLATLEEEDLVEEELIEEMQKKIEELRDQPEEEWFSHSSLEATDTLAESLGLEIRDLAREMETLERDLATLQAFSSQLGPAAREQLEKEFGEALDALGENGLQVNEELLKQLQGIDPSKLGKETLSGLSAEQLKALQEQLRQGSGKLGSLEGLPGEGEDGSQLAMGMGMSETPGLAPGMGGISRGRGDAPLFFGKEDEGLGTSNLETVENPDLSRATVGEVLGLGETERELDRTPAAPGEGGAISSPGRGGEAVSRETLLPDEQAVLKRYFK